MPIERKVILDLDPGVGDALAACLALAHPGINVVAITATGGNVSPRQASLNVQALIEHLDPPRWPRIGVADEEQPLRTDGRELWGADGFCGAELRMAELHQQHPSVKVMVEEIRLAPSEVTLIAGGPLTNVAAALQLEPDLAQKVGHLIIVGGTLNGPGDVTAAAEFNVYCDASAASRVLNSLTTMTMLPVDVSRQVPLTLDLMNHLPPADTGAGKLLRTILPRAYQAYRQRLGLECIYAPEAVAVSIALDTSLATTETLPCQVEIAGNLTHGATVIDRRPRTRERANVDVVVQIDAQRTVESIYSGFR